MKKIMIVDDSEVHTLILKFMLEGMELELVTFRSPNGIEELLDQEQPDLLIMDIRLDSANGCQICTSLKTNANYSALPILLTSSNRDYYEEDCLANGFIAKPYSKNGLLEQISNFV